MGQALIVVMLGSLTYAIIEGPALGLVTTSQWALGTAARTVATFATAEPRAAGPLRLLPRDLPQGP